MPEATDYNVQLIWDFFGPHAERTAEHHHRHVRDFVQRESVPCVEAGSRREGEKHWIAWLTVAPGEVERLRQALRPQRGLPVK